MVLRLVALRAAGAALKNFILCTEFYRGQLEEVFVKFLAQPTEPTPRFDAQS